MTRAVVPLVLASVSCAGVYGEVAVWRGTVGVNVGVDFDFDRKGRAAASAGAERDGALSGAVRGDVTVLHLGDDWKLRAGAGGGLGTGGGAVYGGGGLSWYFAPRHALHLLVGAEYSGGVGPVGRLAYVFAFGDTRPDSFVLLPAATRVNLVSGLAETARRRGCRVQEDYTPTAPAALVACDDGQEIFYQQMEGGLTALCKHRGEADCRRAVDDLVAETSERVKLRDAK